MSAHGLHRGHRIVFDEAGQEWRYADNNQPVPKNTCRTCGHCKLPNRVDGHDACLGHVLGVRNACCGHGTEDEAYVTTNNGKRIAGRRALELLELLPRKPL